MLLTLALRLAEVSPSPAATVVDQVSASPDSITSLIPYVTGAGGALVVLLLVSYLFITDRISSVATVTRLRESDNNRFNDMVAQRDALVLALEKANETTASASANANYAMDLVQQILRGGGGDGLPPTQPRRRP